MMKKNRFRESFDNLELRSKEAQNIISTKTNFLNRYSIVILSIVLGTVIGFLLLCNYVEKVKIHGKIMFASEKSNPLGSKLSLNKEYLNIKIYDSPKEIVPGSFIKIKIHDKKKNYLGKISGRLNFLSKVTNSNELNARIKVLSDSLTVCGKISHPKFDLFFSGEVENKKSSLFKIVYKSLIAKK